MSNHCAIVGECYQYSRLKDKDKFMKELESVLNYANGKFNKHIASDFIITSDYKLQGLLSDPHVFVDVVEYIQSELSGYHMIFGISLGLVYTNLRNEIIYDSDGPVLKLAYDMLKRANDRKPSICFKSNSLEDELINSLLFFIESCTNSRTRRQNQIVAAYKSLGSQKEVASKFDIKQPSVSNILKSSMFNEIESAKNSLRKFLNLKYLK